MRAPARGRAGRDGGRCGAAAPRPASRDSTSARVRIEQRGVPAVRPDQSGRTPRSATAEAVSSSSRSATTARRASPRPSSSRSSAAVGSSVISIGRSSSVMRELHERVVEVGSQHPGVDALRDLHGLEPVVRPQRAPGARDPRDRHAQVESPAAVEDDVAAERRLRRIAGRPRRPRARARRAIDRSTAPPRSCGGRRGEDRRARCDLAGRRRSRAR